LMEELLVGRTLRVPTIAANYTAPYDTRATVSTPTERAPAARSACAHADAVAPVVRTSSTSTMFAPAAEVEATKAPWTLARRWAARGAVGAAVARERESQGGHPRARSARASRSASSAAWLNPRSRSRSRANGTGTSTAPEGTAAAHCSTISAASARARVTRRPNLKRCTASRSGPSYRAAARAQSKAGGATRHAEHDPVSA